MAYFPNYGLTMVPVRFSTMFQLWFNYGFAMARNQEITNRIRMCCADVWDGPCRPHPRQVHLQGELLESCLVEKLVATQISSKSASFDLSKIWNRISAMRDNLFGSVCFCSHPSRMIYFHNWLTQNQNQLSTQCDAWFAMSINRIPSIGPVSLRDWGRGCLHYTMGLGGLAGCHIIQICLDRMRTIF